MASDRLGKSIALNREHPQDYHRPQPSGAEVVSQYWRNRNARYEDGCRRIRCSYSATSKIGPGIYEPKNRIQGTMSAAVLLVLYLR